jgi:hypothetical protein
MKTQQNVSVRAASCSDWVVHTDQVEVSNIHQAILLIKYLIYTYSKTFRSKSKILHTRKANFFHK